MTTYSYTKAVNVSNLEKEIQTSSITVALDGISLTGTDLQITFKAALSSAENDTLDALVTAHDASIPSPKDPLVVELDGTKTPTIQTTPFTSTGGFRFRGASFSGDVSANSTQDIDYEITQERWINGGRAIIDNIGEDDTVTFQVVDKNNVLGFGAGLVLDEFISGFYVPQDGSLEIALAYPAKILQGLFLRIKYTSTHASGCKVKCNLYLHWKAE